MENLPQKIKDLALILSSAKLRYSTEAELQEEIARLLTHYHIPFQREYVLSAANRIDFLIMGAIGVEIKIKGQPLEIYRQVERYAKFDKIKAILLVTTFRMGFPSQIENKPAAMVNLSRGWL